MFLGRKNLMKVFTKIYDLCIKLSEHRLAPLFLVINSFIESIFWPIPVDVILAPMCLANTKKSLLFALYATVASVLGAIVGYYLGYFLYDPYLKDLFVELNYTDSVTKVCELLTEYGILFIIVGSFTPLPYKIVAICCGLIASQQVIEIGSAGQLSIIYFVIVSFLGRGLRFFLIAYLIKLGGESMEKKIRKYIDIIGWVCLLVISIVLVWYYLQK